MRRPFFRRTFAFSLTLALCIGFHPATLATGSTTRLTRGEARDILLSAAADYNPDITAGDILRGYPDGNLQEDDGITRVEALVMLSRAFGSLPAPVGDSARWGSPTSFSDTPSWALEELSNIFTSGIVTGTDGASLSPSQPVTEAQLRLFIQRAYALLATNQKDDFYATVNKEWLDSSIIRPGHTLNSTLYEINYNTDQQVAQLIRDVAASNPAEGTAEDKVKTLYQNILDWDARNTAGIEPIRPYLDAIENAATLEELMAVNHRITRETTLSLLLGYGITQDLSDTDRKVLFFSTLKASLPKEYYNDGNIKSLFTQYIATLLTLGGERDQQVALANAASYVELESTLAAASMGQEELADINKAYNIYETASLKALFPNVDLDALLEACGLPGQATCVITDPGLLKAVAALFTEENLDTLKLAMRIGLLSGFGGLLNREFQDASITFNSALLGSSGSRSDEEQAATAVQSYLSDYLSQTYVEKHFSPEAKENVEKMIDDILSVYADRIAALTWMGEETKTKAIEKLKAITVNVGYPDQWEDPFEGVELRSVAEGGSYYENIIVMSKAVLEQTVEEFEQPVDKSAWQIAPYTVNAYYDATSNSINFPAGILQAPLYDVNADYTENLAGIGYVIAHEITHAFDNIGAQFDAEGNQNNWWTESDYAAFQALCQKVIAFYDGVEVIPGVTCNGALTLGENVADMGALACITQIEAQEAQPDYETLYKTVARIWRSTTSREMRAHLASVDTHAPDKLRVNRALQSLDQFYTAFDIQAGDGMYVAPEERVQVW